MVSIYNKSSLFQDEMSYKKVIASRRNPACRDISHKCITHLQTSMEMNVNTVAIRAFNSARVTFHHACFITIGIGTEFVESMFSQKNSKPLLCQSTPFWQMFKMFRQKKI